MSTALETSGLIVEHFIAVPISTHTSSLSSQLLVTEQDIHADQFILNHGANTHIASF